MRTGTFERPSPSPIVMRFCCGWTPTRWSSGRLMPRRLNLLPQKKTRRHRVAARRLPPCCEGPGEHVHSAGVTFNTRGWHADIGVDQPGMVIAAKGRLGVALQSLAADELRAADWYI